MAAQDGPTVGYQLGERADLLGRTEQRFADGLAMLVDQLGRTLRAIGDAQVVRGETEMAKALVDRLSTEIHERFDTSSTRDLVPGEQAQEDCGDGRDPRAPTRTSPGTRAKPGSQHRMLIYSSDPRNVPDRDASSQAAWSTQTTCPPNRIKPLLCDQLRASLGGIEVGSRILCRSGW